MSDSESEEPLSDEETKEEPGPPEELRVLFAAAEYGRADIVASAAKSLQEKLEAPGDPVDLGRVLGDATNDAGARLLQVACDHGKVDAVRALLRVGAYPPVAAPAAWLRDGTPCRAAAHAELMQQVALGDVARVEKCLALLGPAPLLSDCAPFGGDGPLHWAASFGQVAPLQALLAAGVAADALNDDGVTPLHEAAKANHRECVEKLVAAGADVALAVAEGTNAGKRACDLATKPDVQAACAAPERAAPAPAPAAAAPPAAAPRPAEGADGAARCRAPLVWPPPRRCRLLRGAPDLRLGGPSIVVGVEDPDAAEAAYASALRTLRVEIGARFAVVVGPLGEPHDVSFRLCARSTGGPESYRILVARGAAAVVGADAAGLKHGASTLAQLLRFHASCATEAGGSSTVFKLPALAIDDGPDAAVRAGVVDVRGAAAPRAAQVDDDARRLASWRLNALFVLCDGAGMDAFDGDAARAAGGGPPGDADAAEDARGFFGRRFRAAPPPRAPAVPEPAPFPWHSADGGDGYVDCEPDPALRADGTSTPACGALAARCAMRHVACIPTVVVAPGGDAAACVADLVAACRRFGSTECCVRFEARAGDDDARAHLRAAAAALPAATDCAVLWVWGASEAAEAEAAAVLEAATREYGARPLSLAAVLDTADGDPTGGAKLARKRANAADALVCGGADGERPAALRQAPLVASLVAAARACRAERCGGVVVMAAPTQSPNACFPKPLADATALIGAGLAWRADAGADAPSAGGGRSLSQAELEALTAAHLWRLDPPRRDTSGDASNVADTQSTQQRRLTSAAAAVVCGRSERRDPKSDGRGRSLLAECQRGDHFHAPAQEPDGPRPTPATVLDDEAALWPPVAAAPAGTSARDVAEAFVARLAREADSAASGDGSRAADLRAHHRRLSELLKAPYGEDGDLDPTAVWKWHHDELGFFFNLDRVVDEDDGDGDGDENDENDDDGATPGARRRRLRDDADTAHARLRRVLDELHVAVDLLRWMARLRQLLLARATLDPDLPGDPAKLLAAVPSGTRSDVANRLLELLQRGAAIWARRHAPADAAARAFAPAPAFLAAITFDLPNFQYDEIERLILATSVAAP